MEPYRATCFCATPSTNSTTILPPASTSPETWSPGRSATAAGSSSAPPATPNPPHGCGSEPTRTNSRQPALALDLMEEFRPVLADRFLLTLLNRRQIRSEHFEILSGGAVRLTDDGRTAVLGAWQEWKAQPWEHPIAGRDVPAGLLPVVQARILARHLRGDLPCYLPWTAT